MEMYFVYNVSQVLSLEGIVNPQLATCDYKSTGARDLLIIPVLFVDLAINLASFALGFIFGQLQ